MQRSTEPVAFVSINSIWMYQHIAQMPIISHLKHVHVYIVLNGVTLVPANSLAFQSWTEPMLAQQRNNRVQTASRKPSRNKCSVKSQSLSVEIYYKLEKRKKKNKSTISMWTIELWQALRTALHCERKDALQFARIAIFWCHIQSIVYYVSRFIYFVRMK